MNEIKKFPMGLVPISVIMVFAGLATVVIWLRKFLAGPLPQKITLDPVVHNAFILPDFVLSILLFIGAYGLLKLKKFGFVISFLAMGMWLFDLLFVLGITKLKYISISGPSLIFALFVIVYLWIKRDFFV